LAALSVTGDHAVGPVTEKHGDTVEPYRSAPGLPQNGKGNGGAEYSVIVAAGKNVPSIE